jgi:16S rRNA C967 or C1407 C5-methylase (RsmB/RsmF family)/NOL1/NOP2/fmu family ribosome biogenesis protein
VQQKKVPQELLQSLKQVKDFDEESFVQVHESAEKVVSIRLNAAKIKDEPRKLFPGNEKVPWSSVGFYLPSRPQFIFDPLLHAGVYYVQEASGMFLEQCITQTTDVTKHLRVLDLCAAPGGKSVLLQSLITSQSLLVSNEVIKSRVNVLSENISKWGAANVIVTNNDPRDFANLEDFFDVMVVDAPCSGSGLFRREPDAIDEWSAEAVATCSLRQQRILQDAYRCLAKDGLLIYSTCSYSPEEDEMISDWLIKNYELENIRLSTKKEWNIVESQSPGTKAFGYRFFPDKLKGEGFYIACFRKKDGGRRVSYASRKLRLTRVTATEKSAIAPWIKEDADTNFYHHNDEVFAFPAALELDLSEVQRSLYIKKAGVTVGKVVRNELIPAHELALSGIKSEKLPIVSLKKQEALQYLRKEEVTIDSDLRGWALATYAGYDIGWMKILGNRINNYYPREWRILKSGTPE